MKCDNLPPIYPLKDWVSSYTIALVPKKYLARQCASPFSSKNFVGG